ncbi:GNAT family N-acetyltransferase [Nocardioides sp. dk4132]|uniref:GNAT family N-acetyltransferase n=1 Tax=unclassified Nocardioides TaxID=2615069 RepID=UPI001297CE37|nr:MULTISPECIES: GNAT family protein [unclassified Nocardioides]MQW74388.1 GNAT family N-acetyltransferase [Nocardioides sp. dk4132]QGA06330.1 GNAT family N-acetyltransferase [Nocardioides sp. dk884]
MPSPMFTRDLGAGYVLALLDESSVPAVHQLTLENRERLRRWEHWAHEELTEEGQRAYVRAQLAEWVEGRNVPCVILAGDTVVGAAGARIDHYTGTAELGCWIDAAHEGRGAVSRALTSLLGMLFDERRIARVEIRTDVDNARSRVMAERLGFTYDGTLRSAMWVGEERRDVAVYGLLAETWAA